MLQKYLLIPLDIFRESLHNRRRNQNTAGSREPTAEGLQKRKTDSRNLHTGILRNKLEAWLAFIASDRPEDIMEVIRAYPEFQEPYKEVFAFRYQQREEILELKETLKDRDKALEDKDKSLTDASRKLEAQQREVERLKALLQTGQTDLSS